MKITWAQVYALGRGFGISGATIASVLLTIGALNTDQQTVLLNGLHAMTQGAEQFLGGASAVIYIIGPILGGWLIKLGFNAQKLAPILKVITQQYSDRVQIEGKIVVPAEVAKDVPSNQVVSVDDHTS